MKALTKRQQQILDYISTFSATGKPPPSYREVAKHFRFKSTRAVGCHVEALVRKGALHRTDGKARALQAIRPMQALRRQVVDIPIFGSIPASFAEDRHQEAKGCISIDVQTLGIRPSPRTFALKVRGDSMIGRHILDGDTVILEHGRTPRVGEVVAALVDNESTLKTYILDKGNPCLRAENPKYPKLIPAQELVIQGVMVALIRKF